MMFTEFAPYRREALDMLNYAYSRGRAPLFTYANENEETRGRGPSSEEVSGVPSVHDTDFLQQF